MADDRQDATRELEMVIVGAGFAGLQMLHRALRNRLGGVGAPRGRLARMAGAAIGAALLALGVKVAMGPMHPIPRGILVLGTYGVGYFGIAAAIGLEQSGTLIRRALRILRIRR